MTRLLAGVLWLALFSLVVCKTLGDKEEEELVNLIYRLSDDMDGLKNSFESALKKRDEARVSLLGPKKRRYF